MTEDFSQFLSAKRYQLHLQVPAAFCSNVTYGYDVNHNRIRKSQGGLTRQYEYDPENRLTRVLENGQEIGKYSCNPAGLRVKKIEDGKTTVYVYHDSQPIYEETFPTTNQANLGVPARQELSVYLGFPEKVLIDRKISHKTVH